jgi:SH3 domain protein
MCKLMIKPGTATTMNYLKTIRAGLLCVFFSGVITLFLPVQALRAETIYVTDMLQLDLFETEAMTGRPIRKLRSGDRMEVIKHNGRYTNVKLDDGQSGWVISLYLVDKQPARTRLNEIESANETLQAELKKARGQLAIQKGRVKELQTVRNADDAEQLDSAAELSLLRIENADMRSSLAAYAGAIPFSLFFGALVVVLVAGFAVGWYWFDSRSRARHGGYRVY